MRSLKEHFAKENVMREQKEAAQIVTADFDGVFEAAKALNDAWNAEVAKGREIRLKKEKEERETYILSRLDLKKEREDKARRRADEMVRKEMVCNQSVDE